LRLSAGATLTGKSSAVGAKKNYIATHEAGAFSTNSVKVPFYCIAGCRKRQTTLLTDRRKKFLRSGLYAFA